MGTITTINSLKLLRYSMIVNIFEVTKFRKFGAVNTKALFH